MPVVVGRNKEVKIFEQIWKSPQAELVALYGRRRVGKTHLVRSCFGDRGIYVEFTGIQKGSLKRQLRAFTTQISKVFFSGAPIQQPRNWLEAFELLNLELDKVAPSKKITLFFDELPWMATKRSKLLQELDHFWNTKWSLMPNINVILCGSAASWMIDNIIRAKGGLHNRLTRRIKLEPFNLATTKSFIEKLSFNYNYQQVCELYMVTGGIPYYLNCLDKKKSLIQNIESLCFSEEGELFDEFDLMFESLYKQSQANIRIVRAIFSKKKGIKRDDLLKKVKMKSGGSFNKRIHELEAAGFIHSFIPYGKAKKSIYFRVTDEYVNYYLKWIEPAKKAGYIITKGYWQTKYHTAEWYNWAGHTFENICLKHVEQIRSALDLQQIGCIVSSWKYIPANKSKTDGAQIDLLFDRDDNAISLFEIKYTNTAFSIDKDYAKALSRKIDVFEGQTLTKKQVMLVMITANGLKQTLWSEDLISAVVILDDLFAF